MSDSDVDEVERAAVEEILNEVKKTENSKKQQLPKGCINQRLLCSSLVSTLRNPVLPRTVRKRKFAGLNDDYDDGGNNVKLRWPDDGHYYDPDTKYIYDARNYVSNPKSRKVKSKQKKKRVELQEQSLPSLNVHVSQSLKKHKVKYCHKGRLATQESCEVMHDQRNKHNYHGCDNSSCCSRKKWTDLPGFEHEQTDNELELEDYLSFADAERIDGTNAEVSKLKHNKSSCKHTKHGSVPAELEDKSNIKLHQKHSKLKNCVEEELSANITKARKRKHKKKKKPKRSFHHQDCF